jgi:hypothetical protein
VGERPIGPGSPGPAAGALRRLMRQDIAANPEMSTPVFS